MEVGFTTNNKVRRKILPFVQLQRTTPPLPHPQNTSISKWHLVQPLQRETYTKRQPLSPKYSCSELNSLIMYQWLVNTWTFTAPIGSPIICTPAPAHICEQWERNLTTRFRRCSWGRNAWQTPKKVCEGGKQANFIIEYCIYPRWFRANNSTQ